MYSKFHILITKHPLLAGDLFMYMAIIRGAISDAMFDRVYMYDQQFRLRMSLNPTNSWSQIDGTFGYDLLLRVLLVFRI
jgi:hypothetical protein